MALTLRPEFAQGTVEIGSSVTQDEAFTLRMTPYLKGDPGDAAAQFIHTQSAPLDTWTVNHNKGYRPSVQVYSPGWVEIEANIIHVSENQIVVQLNEPLTGFVIC